MLSADLQIFTFRSLDRFYSTQISSAENYLLSTWVEIWGAFGPRARTEVLRYGALREKIELNAWILRFIL